MFFSQFDRLIHHSIALGLQAGQDVPKFNKDFAKGLTANKKKDFKAASKEATQIIQGLKKIRREIGSSFQFTVNNQMGRVYIGLPSFDLREPGTSAPTVAHITCEANGEVTSWLGDDKNLDQIDGNVRDNGFAERIIQRVAFKAGYNKGFRF